MKKYSGEIAYFPQEVVEKMIERQMECGNKGDVSVFERYKKAGDLEGGFTWSNTTEGNDFWCDVIKHKEFDVFFAKYPKKQSEYPKVMLVSNDMSAWFRRVVIMEKRGLFMSWTNAETIDGAKDEMNIFWWCYAKDVEQKPEPIELTIDEIAEKFGIKPEQIKIKK